VRKGDRVVLTLPNCPEYVIAFFAIQKLGAVLVNAGPLMGIDDLRTLMALTSPHVVIGLDLQAPQIMRAAGDASPAHFVWVTLQSYQTLVKRLGYQIKLWHGAKQRRGPPST
jgi:long-chain acyl-CoA synthetase